MTLVAPSNTALDAYIQSKGLDLQQFLADFTLVRKLAYYSIWDYAAVTDLVVSSPCWHASWAQAR